jgi:hypothetical protein
MWFHKIYFNIILPSLSRYWKLFHSLTTLYTFFLTDTCYTPPPHHFLRDFMNLIINIQFIIQLTKFSIIQSIVVYCYVLRHTPKCLPQHPILEYHSHKFFPLKTRPRSTPIQNSRQYYISLYFKVLLGITQTKASGSNDRRLCPHLTCRWFLDALTC